MKKAIAVLIVFMLILLSGCVRPPESDSSEKQEYESTEFKNTASSGVWISFSEINAMLKSENGFKAEFQNAVEGFKQLGINEIYIHIRAYCDSLFPSSYFPLISAAQGLDYDAFAYALNLCRENGIKVHAWLNPYRVLSSSGDIEKLPALSPAYKWLKDDNPENDINVIRYSGIYLNPAESEVRELIINGVREILEKYDVDGVHIDDYFYPTTDAEFDKASYEKYCAGTDNPLALDDWRRANVNMMVEGCYNAVKYVNKDIKFTVSPAASVTKNYEEFYADVKEWIRSGYIDEIIPQLYFGYNYPDEGFRFEKLLSEWVKLSGINGKVKLKVGLAPYKLGSDTAADKEEWENGTDVVSRQTAECIKNGSVAGCVYFSYSSLFSPEEKNTEQREKIKNALLNSH